MAYSSKKIPPSKVLKILMPPIFFDKVRSSNLQRSTRSRQCFRCGQNIGKGERYISHQFNYDDKIMTVGFHAVCFTGEKFDN